MSQKSRTPIAVIGIDIGKNSFHVVGHDGRGCDYAATEVVATYGPKMRRSFQPAREKLLI
jgi:hypothetical protein